MCDNWQPHTLVLPSYAHSHVMTDNIIRRRVFDAGASDKDDLDGARNTQNLYYIVGDAQLFKILLSQGPAMDCDLLLL